MKTTTFLPMSCWAAEDIPTNRIIDKSPQHLSTSELLSIIIGSGTATETPVEIARKILASCGGSLSTLYKMSPEKLTAISGIGRQKAARIIAAAELSRRRQEEAALEPADLGTATRIYNFMHPFMADLDVEEFWAVYMNQNYKFIKKMRIARGDITEVSVDVRIIMREAVLSNATILAVCHNHPSGSLTPSKADDQLTLTIKQACQIMRILFLDHVIITDGCYYSYREQGKL